MSARTLEKTRATLERLREASEKSLETLSWPQRLVLAPMLAAHFVVMDDLINELEKLRGEGHAAK